MVIQKKNWLRQFALPLLASKPFLWENKKQSQTEEPNPKNALILPNEEKKAANKYQGDFDMLF